MIALIEDNRDAIVALCKQYGVRRLSVFGSAAKGTFDLATSDIDFVVDYIDWGPGIFHRFFGFVVALEELLGRRVDMTTEPIEGPAFRAEVEWTEIEFFASDSDRTAA